MTLHKAIQEVLLNSGVPMKVSAIAEEINKQGLYSRADKKQVPANQISARVAKYPSLFGINTNHEVFLANTAVVIHALVTKLDSILYNFVDRSKSALLLPALIFYSRVRVSKTIKEKLGVEYESFCNPIQEFTKEELLVTFQLITDKLSSDIWIKFIKDLLSNIPNDIIADCLLVLKDADLSPRHISSQSFGNFFNELLSFENRIIRDSGEYTTPVKVLNFLAKEIVLNDGDIVFDPFAGACGLITKLSSHNSGKNIKFIAQDLSSNAAVLGQMNMILNEVDYISYNIKDSINSQLDLFDNTNHNKQANVICTVPPFVLNKQYKNYQHSLPNHEHQLDIVIASLLSFMNKGDRTYVIVPESLLFSNDRLSRYTRVYLINNDLLKGVISLPVNAFNPFSSVKTSILIIEKSPTKSDLIAFGSLNSNFEFEKDKKDINFVSEPNISYNTKYDNILPLWNSFDNLTSETFSKHQVEGNDFVLKKNLLEYNYLSNKYDIGFVNLEELILNRRISKNVKESEVLPNGDIPLITISQLSTSLEECIVVDERIKSFIDESTVENLGLWYIPENSIICSKIGSKLKPTLIEKGDKFVAGSNIVVLTIDTTKVNPRYLVGQFYSDYFIEQLNLLSVGTAMPFIRLDALLSIKVKLPSLADQLFYVENTFKHLSFKFEKSDETKRLYQILKHVKHSYSQLADAIQSDIYNLKSYIENKQMVQEPVALYDAVSKRKGTATVDEVFTRLTSNQNDAKEIFSTIQTILEISNSDLRYEKTNIKDFFNDQAISLKELCDSLNIYIVTELHSKDLLIQIDQRLFKELLRNLIKNACVHGFNSRIDNKVIAFEICKNEDPTKLTINYYNNGSSFPESFTFNEFISFGGRNDSSKGSGLGGHLIHEIVKKHDGDLVYVSETDSFPIKKYNTSIMVGVHFQFILPKL